MHRPPSVRRAILAALWFMFLTFPLLVIKVNPVEQRIDWRWQNLLWVGGSTFLAVLAAGLIRDHQTALRRPLTRICTGAMAARSRLVLSDPGLRLPLLGAFTLLALAAPGFLSSYQITIFSTALLYMILGLGLNIVVGLAGLLDLGYVAFYAAGAYTYGLLHLHFGLGFWLALPVGGLVGALFGLLVGLPVLRLRGDYLAIVTLAFGQIVRLVLENWTDLSRGPSGIANIPRPGLFGVELSLDHSIIYFYYLMIALVLVTIFVTNRLQDSRIGRAWQALREDEVACQAMGIDRTRLKLAAFGTGAALAGMAGVLFAARTTFINPASFTFLESVIILCIVILGGMGSVLGILAASLILILLPEYLRALADYRMLVFGASLVAMMLFRPQGIVGVRRRTYTENR